MTHCGPGSVAYKDPMAIRYAISSGGRGVGQGEEEKELVPTAYQDETHND